MRIEINDRSDVNVLTFDLRDILDTLPSRYRIIDWEVKLWEGLAAGYANMTNFAIEILDRFERGEGVVLAWDGLMLLCDSIVQTYDADLGAMSSLGKIAIECRDSTYWIVTTGDAEVEVAIRHRFRSLRVH